MPKTANVAELLKRGDGRYSVGELLYLVVRGGSALWEYRYRQNRQLRSLWLGSAVGLAPMTLTQARAARAQAWLRSPQSCGAASACQPRPRRHIREGGGGLHGKANRQVERD